MLTAHSFYIDTLSLRYKSITTQTNRKTDDHVKNIILVAGYVLLTYN